jgi:hypothetical protein
LCSSSSSNNNNSSSSTLALKQLSQDLNISLKMLLNLISSVFKQEHAVELQAGDGGWFEGKVVVRKKGFIDLNDGIAHVADGLSEAMGRRITLRLVSADRILGIWLLENSCFLAFRLLFGV